ncbi:hypothetical protein J8273_1604 [Carpediemonas membranifera]|uniref:Uncharacterized protein n=1 Tax=Carpediemonas membranifera TaxID=201153 RepID=A0A8J6EB92_9EUKA|nr:hypothetical protein J8273_1604 [Carpediemonas membranifera]|eukprot:KAG9396595.1 hypothetical protein J8273_1604 [Carpediemonas membranifera]
MAAENHRLVVFSELTDAKKEFYYNFIAKRNVSFRYDEQTDEYVAKIVVQRNKASKPGPVSRKSPMDRPGTSIPRASSRSSGRSSSTSRQRPQSQRWGSSRAKSAGPRARPHNRPTRGFGRVDMAEIEETYSSLVSQLRTRPRDITRHNLAWLYKMVNGIYDMRYEHDMAQMELEQTIADGDATADDHMALSMKESIRRVPNFVIHCFTKQYGLRTLVERHCWELLLALHSLRASSLFASTFVSFLCGKLSTDDLLFFLFARNVATKHLAKAPRTMAPRDRAASLVRPRTVGAASPEPTVPPKTIALIARKVFGSEPLVVFFLRMLRGRLSAADGVPLSVFLAVAVELYSSESSGQSIDAAPPQPEAVSPPHSALSSPRSAGSPRSTASPRPTAVSFTEPQREPERRPSEREQRRVRDEQRARREERNSPDRLGQHELTQLANLFEDIRNELDVLAVRYCGILVAPAQDAGLDDMDVRQLHETILTDIRRLSAAIVSAVTQDPDSGALDGLPPDVRRTRLQLQDTLLDLTTRKPAPSEITAFCRKLIGSEDLRDEVEPRAAWLLAIAVDEAQSRGGRAVGEHIGRLQEPDPNEQTHVQPMADDGGISAPVYDQGLL